VTLQRQEWKRKEAHQSSMAEPTAGGPTVASGSPIITDAVLGN
jgi:hypothetical protein